MAETETETGEHGVRNRRETTAQRAREWDDAYAGAPPWDIGRPQRAFVGLAQAGRLRGRLLDIGCGTGENTMLAATVATTALGVDISPRAVEKARDKARRRGAPAVFEVADALRIDRLDQQFDTVIDSGTFHSFDDDERAAYVEALGAVVRPGGGLHILCFSDATPGTWGPRRIGRDEFARAFTDGWAVESIDATDFEITQGNPPGHVFAWLATVVRT